MELATQGHQQVYINVAAFTVLKARDFLDVDNHCITKWISSHWIHRALVKRTTE